MKPMPDLNDDTAMILRGKRSAVASARKDATESLRDAYTLMQSDHWSDLAKQARLARDAADRLITIAALWDELT